LGKALAQEKRNTQIAEETARATREALEEREKELARKEAELSEYKARLQAMGRK
jgi:hypothetical protein